MTNEPAKSIRHARKARSEQRGGKMMKNLDDIAKEHGIDNIDLGNAASLKRKDMKFYCRGNSRKRSGMSLAI